jgi:hypothetical protein
MTPPAPWPQPADEGSLRARVAFFVVAVGGAVSLGSVAVAGVLGFLDVQIPENSLLERLFGGCVVGGLSVVGLGGAIEGRFQLKRLRLEGLSAVLISFGFSALLASVACLAAPRVPRALIVALLAMGFVSLLLGGAVAILSSLRRARQRGDTAVPRNLLIVALASLWPLLLVSLGLWHACG